MSREFVIPKDLLKGRDIRLRNTVRSAWISNVQLRVDTHSRDQERRLKILDLAHCGSERDFGILRQEPEQRLKILLARHLRIDQVSWVLQVSGMSIVGWVQCGLWKVRQAPRASDVRQLHLP